MKGFFGLSAILLSVLLLALHWTLPRSPLASDVVELAWATDANPMRQEQMTLFREWYQAKYGRAISIFIDPANYDQSKIVVQSVAGAGPDLFDYYGPASLRGLVESGVILDVSDAAQQGGFGTGRFWPVLQSTMSLRGRQYAVPDNGVCKLILIDREAAEQTHTTLPALGWTWKDLVLLGQALALRDAQGRITRYGLLGISWSDLILQNGGSFFDATGKHCVLNRPETVEALQFFADLRFKYHILPSAGELASLPGQGNSGASENLNLLADGRGAMLEYGRYGYIMIRRLNQERAAAGQAPLRITPLPPLSEKRTATSASGRCTGVNRRTRHPVEAVRFLEFLASREFNDQINRAPDGINTMPVFAGGRGGITGGRPYEEGCDDPIWRLGMEQSLPLHSSPYLNGAVMDRIELEEIERFTNGLQDAAQTAARLQDRLNGAITRYLRDRPDLQRQWLRDDDQEPATAMR